MPFKFEQLKVWQQAVDLTEKIHLLTKTFPKDETFVLAQQIKRAADSVALNIAEGSTGQSNDEFKRFLGYAIRSAIEVVSCLYLTKRRGYLANDTFQELYDFLDALVRSLQALRNSLH